MITRKLSLILFIVMLCVRVTIALESEKPLENYIIDSWRSANGLPSDTILSITQTPDGFLWLGTQNGLVRFDGVRFKRMQDTDSVKLENIRISYLYADRSNSLWIATQNGLIQYHQNQFRKYTKDDGLLANNIGPIHKDIHGNIWLGIPGFGLQCMKNDGITTYPASLFDGGRQVSAILEDSKGVLWIGFHDKGLFRFVDGEFIKRKFTGLSGEISIRALYEDKSGAHWRGTSRGLMLFQEGESRLFTTHIGGLSNNCVTAIIQDNHQNLWVATNNGLNRILTSTTGARLIQTGFGNLVINCLFEDKAKSIWIGTDGAGLKHLRDGKVKTLTMKDGLWSDYICSLYQRANGDIWIGTSTGLGWYNPSGFSQYPTPSNTPKYALAEDHEGQLWVGTGGRGIILVRGYNFYRYTSEEGLASDLITTIFKDSRDWMWIGTNQGISRFRDNKFQNMTAGHGLSSNLINGFFENHNGDVWVCTANGVSVIPQGEWAGGNIKTLLENISISYVFEEKNGIYWVCTLGDGLKRVDGEQIDSFDIHSGLACNTLYKLIEDEEGNFWISSDKGIIRINKQEFDRYLSGEIPLVNCRVYGLTDGMKSLECFWSSQNSVIKTQEGSLYFATKNGLSIIDPRKIRLNKDPPLIYLDDILVNGETVAMTSTTQSFDDDARFEFHFTSPTFVTPEKTIFRYRLEGWEEWQFLKNNRDRKAVYENLKPGSYRFTVTACNSDGIWNTTGAVFSFRTRTVFFRTTWFLVLLVLVILGLLFSGFWILKKKFNKKTKRYKDSQLDPSLVNDITRNLTKLLEVDKVFLDENLSLGELAQRLSVSSHILSQIINEKLNKSFFDLVNSYRVEEAKMQLIDPKAKDLSVLIIAYDSGFSTKSSFNRAFKKHTGLTPTEFRKKNQ